MIKIKTKSAFVDENGNFAAAGDIVYVTKEFLDSQNQLCELFGLEKHEVIEETTDTSETGKTEVKSASKAKTATKPEDI